VIIWKEFTFDSAHYLPNVPVDHKCGRMHGHTFKVRVEVSGDFAGDLGWVMDFSTVKDVVDPLVKMIDHTVLNDFMDLENPTSENLAVWFWNKIKPDLPALTAIEVQETCNSGARYSP
jgi:6-pyruvoyltetrahydropterin/6-carboxytetrahydropterin synthase